MAHDEQSIPMPFIWVFHGIGASYASGVFTTKEEADEWIAGHRLSGLLTLYPLDEGSYDWAIAQGEFTPKGDDQTSADFIRRFLRCVDHHHYQDGICVA